MFLICHPKGFTEEREYIYKVILKDFFGLDYETRIVESETSVITLKGDEEKGELVLGETFFNMSQSRWMNMDSMPKRPLKRLILDKSKYSIPTISPVIPVIFGSGTQGDDIFNIDGNRVYLNIDVFGSAFFMLTRYEEIVIPERDNHGRFAGTNSLAFKEGFIDRPIINEYMEILWWAISFLWPETKRKERKFSVFLTHDVDCPLETRYENFPKLLRAAAGDMVKRKSFRLALKHIIAWFIVKLGFFDFDLCNTFDYIMDVSEKYSLKDSFYFMTENNDKMDGNFYFEEPWVKELIYKIHRRRHEIGIHFSYNSFNNSELARREFSKLREFCSNSSITQEKWGGRNHYLRFNAPFTWHVWEVSGIDYDSTLGYADIPGFRCGLCYEFQLFNLFTRKTMQLTERPLIVMDGTFFTYMKLPDEAILDNIIKLYNCCRMFNGDFTLLWHNSELVQERHKKLYRKIIDEIGNNFLIPNLEKKGD